VLSGRAIREADKGTAQFVAKCVFKDGSHVIPPSAHRGRPSLCALCMRVRLGSLFLNLSCSFSLRSIRSLFLYACLSLSLARSFTLSLSLPPFPFDVASLFHCRPGTDRSAPILFRIMRILDVTQVLIRYYSPNSKDDFPPRA